jgi:16S rRNA (cytidine1402-2'-O)-methyltransferase
VIKAKAAEQRSLSFDEVLHLDLPPKPKAKLLARLDGSDIKEWYKKLTEST